LWFSILIEVSENTFQRLNFPLSFLTLHSRNNTMKKSLVYLLFFAVLAIGSRIIPHWPNFTAMIAVTFAGGLMFSNKIKSLLFPLLIVFVSDLILNNTIYSQGEFTWFTQGSGWLYGSYILIVLLGALNSSDSKLLKSLAIGGTVSAVLFFIISNFGVWASGTMYSKDFAGLLMCYLAASEYLLSQVLGTLAYGAIIYGFARAYEGELQSDLKLK